MDCGLLRSDGEGDPGAARAGSRGWRRLKVYKNTLMRLALSESDLPTLDDLLEGPSAFVFAGGDVAAAAKVVKNFAKANDNLEIKAA